MKMIELKHPLLTNNYTRVFHEAPLDQKFNAPHHFQVHEANLGDVARQTLIAEVDFQEGPILEVGVNGVANEDLLCMVLARLEGFQSSKFACRENAVAITKIEEGLLWLRKRTMGREQRGVEGRHII